MFSDETNSKLLMQNITYSMITFRRSLYCLLGNSGSSCDYILSKVLWMQRYLLKLIYSGGFLVDNLVVVFIFYLAWRHNRWDIFEIAAILRKAVLIHIRFSFVLIWIIFPYLTLDRFFYPWPLSRSNTSDISYIEEESKPINYKVNSTVNK